MRMIFSEEDLKRIVAEHIRYICPSAGVKWEHVEIKHNYETDVAPVGIVAIVSIKVNLG